MSKDRKEYMRKYWHDYYLKNKNEILAKQKEYQHKNKEYISKRHKKYNQKIQSSNKVLTELEEYYKEQLEFIIELPAYTKDIAQEHKVMELCYEDFLNKIQELKEKYK